MNFNSMPGYFQGRKYIFFVGILILIDEISLLNYGMRNIEMI